MYNPEWLRDWWLNHLIHPWRWTNTDWIDFYRLNRICLVCVCVCVFLHYYQRWHSPQVLNNCFHIKSGAKAPPELLFSWKHWNWRERTCGVSSFISCGVPVLLGSFILWNSVESKFLSVLFQFCPEECTFNFNLHFLLRSQMKDQKPRLTKQRRTAFQGT